MTACSGRWVSMAGCFEEYDPFEAYYSDRSSSPHLNLLNLAPIQVDDVIRFVTEWELLCTALWPYRLCIDALMDGADFTKMSWGEQRILSEVRPSRGYMEYWSGTFYESIERDRNRNNG